MMKFLVIVKKEDSKSLKVAKRVTEFLQKIGINIVCDASTSKDMSLPAEELSKTDAELAVVLGGDGTLLWAESHISGKTIPILGINLGTMGFLTEVTPDNWENALERVLQGRYSVAKLAKIDVSINGEHVGRALNEVVVKTVVPVEMLNIEIKVDDENVETVRADGIIVSTPTGSTAYSMSVGGPIVDNRVRALIITAISPFKLGARPFVVPDTSKISIKISGDKHGVVVIDGEFRKEVYPGDVIECTHSKHQANIIKFEKDFYDKVRRRLRR